MSSAASMSLVNFARRHPRVFVLTGAGVSTASGIPAYRDDTGAWSRRAPITLQEFLRSVAMRQRYWARSMIGWRAIKRALPNAGHRALAELERAGHVHTLVTQNVDGLHLGAGSTRVIELHGNLARVRCLGCGTCVSRAALQAVLCADNPAHAAAVAKLAPDGDAELDTEFLTAFQVPACVQCGGMLKPDVVFFGEGVPRERVQAAFSALDGADAMLVVGSSLMVWSGYRFCEHAARTGRPIAAINRGRTRADALFALHVDADCGETLAQLAAALESGEGGLV